MTSLLLLTHCTISQLCSF